MGGGDTRRSYGTGGADRTSYSASIRRSLPQHQRGLQGHTGYSPRDEYSDLDEKQAGVVGAGTDPFGNRNVGRWYAREASPKQRREFDNVFESLEQFRQSNAAADPTADRRGSTGNYGYNNTGNGIVPRINMSADFDDFGPKTSDSIRFSASGLGIGGGGNRYSRYGSSGHSNTGISMSMESPRYGGVGDSAHSQR